MSEFSELFKKYRFPIIVFVVFLTITSVMLYLSVDPWNISSLSRVGSLASVFALLIVIWQLMKLAENTDDLKSRTEELNDTYSSAIYNLINSDTIFKISRANEKIKLIKKMFHENKITDSLEHFDHLFTTLTELDQYTTLNGFEGKIDGEQLSSFIGFCTAMTTRIYSEDNIDKANLTEEFSRLYELESFLIAVNNNLRIN